MMTEKLCIGVIFGGRSVEHDVSVLTGLQVTQALNKDRYDVVPIYISKEGEWFTGDSLLNVRNYRGYNLESAGATHAAIPPDRGIHGLLSPLTSGILQRTKVLELDVIIPAVHGTNGEDGSLQGLLELADIPYVGCGIAASALGMNKHLTKKILSYHNIPVLPFQIVKLDDWKMDQQPIIASVEKSFGYPVFVKPNCLGSSVGVSQAKDAKSLAEALEAVFSYDDLALVEQSAVGCIEVNCSVIRSRTEVMTSVCEQPVSWENFLTYEDKYMRGDTGFGMNTARRQIPAPISEEMTERVKRLAAEAFTAIDGYGVARVDFFVNEKDNLVFLNELNTIPGSFSFYLWQPLGWEPHQVMDKLIDIAIENYQVRKNRILTYDIGLLEKASISGLNFGKLGSKTP
jgi:D-alanine-D-alanine ligase